MTITLGASSNPLSLANMQSTVRKMTARYTSQAMTDEQINSYINLSYTIHMPLNFKNSKLTKPYVFTTVPNVDTYVFPYENGLLTNAAGQPVPGNIQISPPVYCQGYILRYYQDKTTFYNRWPNLSVNQQIGTGSGLANTTYTGTIPPFPFYRAQMNIFGQVAEPMVYISAYDSTGGVTSGFNYVLTDIPQLNNDLGNLYDSAGNNVGDINYITGFYEFTPANSFAIPDTAGIYAAVVPYQASRPTDVLFYNQLIVLRPCPRQVYNIEFQVSRQPTQLIVDEDIPELDEWYLFICAGAAKLIYTDFPDEEGMAYLAPIWEEQLRLCNRRTLRQLSNQRSQTIFSAPGWSRNWGSYFYGSEYSGS